MANEIVPYHEMCAREGLSLQRGMNFNEERVYSIVLMSVRRNAPYQDWIEGDGSILIYEGHDVPRSAVTPNPKSVDQVAQTGKGTLTENGKFLAAAVQFKNEKSPARRVRVYEKIREGIWSYNGVFALVDAWTATETNRSVFKFRLEAAASEIGETTPRVPLARRRIIPTRVKLEVWARDGGKCVQCGARDELHFDHDFPFSKGGTSITAANVQLLCARHNLEKSDRIL